MTDSELKRYVETELHREVRLRGRDINVAIEDGKVVLKGHVPEIAEKRLALNLVRRLREVGEVRDQLRLFIHKEMTDTQIENHIRDGWEQDVNLDHRTLRVESRNGTVMLGGQVDSLEAKRLAGLIAWWVPGVADVDNGIEVVPEQKGDVSDLVDSIRQAFYKDVLVNADTIGVAARHGTVTLTGYVSSDEERQAAIHDAYFIWGVDEVIDKLSIVPR